MSAKSKADDWSVTGANTISPPSSSSADTAFGHISASGAIPTFLVTSQMKRRMREIYLENPFLMQPLYLNVDDVAPVPPVPANPVMHLGVRDPAAVLRQEMTELVAEAIRCVELATLIYSYLMQNARVKAAIDICESTT